MKSRVAIIAAMAREVRPLVRRWKLESGQDRVTVYSSPKAVVAFAGMGALRAELAVEAAFTLGPIDRLVSAGWAGGLRAGMDAGAVCHVSRVIDAATGEAFATEAADQRREEAIVLVSTVSVASIAEKLRLHETFHAHLVDMEAAAVARCAKVKGLPFTAIKAVSDAHDFELEGMERFATLDGRFREGAFAVYAALRPGLWRRVMRMARNSANAAENLCRELEVYLGTDEIQAEKQQQA